VYDFAGFTTENVASYEGTGKENVVVFDKHYDLNWYSHY
jgi:hypothetical protein